MFEKCKAESLVLDESAPDELVNSALALKQIKSSKNLCGGWARNVIK